MDDLLQLETALTHSNVDVRKKAINILANLGPPAERLLVLALNDKDTGLRKLAASALETTELPLTIQTLVKLLGITSREIRSEIARLLIYIGIPAMEYLMDALEHQNTISRKTAAYILGEIGNMWAVDPLLNALHDLAPPVRRQAALALGKLKHTYTIPRLIDALSDLDITVHNAAITALKNIGDPAVEALALALFSPDIELSGNAAEALGAIKNLQAVESLIYVLRNHNARVRQRAAEALGNIGDLQALPSLSDALYEPDPNVRQMAAYALGELENPAALGPLIDAMETADPPLREYIALAMGKIGHFLAVDPLVMLLNDPNEDVRVQAAFSLGKIQDTRSVVVLCNRLNDHNSPVRAYAISALGEIGDKQAVSALVNTLKDKELADLGVSALVKIGEAGVPSMLRFVHHPDTKIRNHIRNVLREILQERYELTINTAPPYDPAGYPQPLYSQKPDQFNPPDFAEKRPAFEKPIDAIKKIVKKVTGPLRQSVPDRDKDI